MKLELNIQEKNIGSILETLKTIKLGKVITLEQCYDIELMYLALNNAIKIYENNREYNKKVEELMKNFTNFEPIIGNIIYNAT